ncbi:MAG: hypothetical protein WBW33_06505 [Bryobacteraceae bacterium]
MDEFVLRCVFYVETDSLRECLELCNGILVSTSRAKAPFFESAKDAAAKRAADPKNAGSQLDLAASYDELGETETQAHSFEANQAFEQGLEIRQTAAAMEPRNALTQRDLAMSYRGLGETASARGDAGAGRARPLKTSSPHSSSSPVPTPETAAGSADQLQPPPEILSASSGFTSSAWFSNSDVDGRSLSNSSLVSMLSSIGRFCDHNLAANDLLSVFWL